MDKTLGQIAFEAHDAVFQSNGNPADKWEWHDGMMIEAWEAAAQAVAAKVGNRELQAAEGEG